MKNIPENKTLVTLDVSSLNTNIYCEEGAQACFKKLEEKKNKHVPSIVIKSFHPISLNQTLSHLAMNIIPSRPDPGRREKINLNSYLHTSLWCLKTF